MAASVQNHTKKSLLPVALIFGLVGILPLGLGIYVYRDMQSFVSTAVPAEGEVVSIFLASSKARTGGSDLKTYAPEVLFQTAEGMEVRHRATASSGDPGYGVGDTVGILYDPLDPEQAEINSFFHLWLLPTIMIGLGSIFTALALLFIFLDIKDRKAKDNHQTPLAAQAG